MGTGTGVALPAAAALGVENEKEHVAPIVYVSVNVKDDNPMIDTDMGGTACSVTMDWPGVKSVTGADNVTVVCSSVGTTSITVTVASSAKYEGPWANTTANEACELE
jgi:hypothetical protein